MIYYSSDIVKTINERQLKTVDNYIKNESTLTEYPLNRLYTNGVILMFCAGLSVCELLQSDIWTEDGEIMIKSPSKHGPITKNRKLIHLTQTDFINRLHAFRRWFYDLFSVLDYVNLKGRIIKVRMRRRFYKAITEVFDIPTSDDNEFVLFNSYYRILQTIDNDK